MLVSMQRLAWLRRLDIPLLVSVLVLLSIGLIILQAINFKDAQLAQDFSANKQIVSALIGLAAMALLARVDYRVWFRLGKYWYGIGIALLLLVLAVGQTTAGSRLAINLGILQFQPAEFMKIGLIMMLAWFFAKYSSQMRRFRFVLFSALFLVVPMGLIALEPDFGSAIVLGFVWLVMLMCSSANKLQIVVVLAAALLVAPFVTHLLQPYQQRRIETFLNPLSDPQGAGYNVVQSQIAVGSGGWFGKGLGSGSQSQLNFLPSQHTDFIFAVTAEKLGFFGALLVLALFILVLVRGVLIAWRAADAFGMLMAAGVVAMLFFHFMINVGMNLGVMPVTGIPLPLLSYGGTNLIVSLAGVGLLLSIGIHRKELKFRR